MNLRSDEQEDYLATLTAKTVPIAIGRNGFGLAISGAVVYRPRNRTGNGFIVNVPVTFEFSKSFASTSILGHSTIPGDPHGLYATAGAGVSWSSFRTGVSFPKCLPSWGRANEPALPNWAVLQSHQGHRLGLDLRTQSAW